MDHLNVVIAGAAGEGVQTVGEVLTEPIAAHGYAVLVRREAARRGKSTCFCSYPTEAVRAAFFPSRYRNPLHCCPQNSVAFNRWNVFF